MKKFSAQLSVSLVVLLIFCIPASAVLTENKILPSDGTAEIFFGGGKNDGGAAVSISGDYAIVGAQGARSAYIYYFDGVEWLEQQKLTSGANSFGISVSISGNNAIVGSLSDSANIYHYDGTSWVEQQILTASDAKPGSYFGESVSISGNQVVVGAHFADGNSNSSGAAYLYYFDGSNWVEQQKLIASDGDTSDLFGCAVSISGDFAIVGAWYDGDYLPYAGSAYIFGFDGNNWVEQQKVYASDVANDIRFGYAVSISGENAIVGAMSGNGLAERSGSAYILHYDGSSWVEQQELNASDGEYVDWYGFSVSISGDNAIVGGRFHGQDGAAYLYHFDSTEWVEDKILTPGAANDPLYGFGSSVAISGDRAIVGDPLDLDNGRNSGSVYIYSDLLADPSIDADSDGYVSADDCNDNDASVNPGAVEVCEDGMDNDCDALTDTSDPECPVDVDGDGYDVTVDCNDNDASINSGVTEICDDGKDNDCDDLTDTSDSECPVDVDGDGDGDGDGYDVTVDCNDNDASINSGAPEICDDGKDNDCDDLTDTADPDCPVDDDSDGYDITVDCNDSDATINPGSIEVCEDRLDNNCDGLTDIEDTICTPICEPTSRQEKGKKCYDGIDNDCDGLMDNADPDCFKTEGKGKTCSDGIDNDMDGLTDCDDSGCSTNRVCEDIPTTPGDKPDLVVTDIIQDGPISLKVKYKNIGVAEDGDFLIKIRSGGKSFEGNPYYRFPVPAPGEELVTGGFGIHLIGLKAGRVADVTATIDWENRVDEQNEDNNSLTKQIVIE